MDAKKEYLTVREAQQLLGCSRTTLYQRIWQGYLTPYRFPGGRRIYFKRTELERLLVPAPYRTRRVRRVVEEVEE